MSIVTGECNKEKHIISHGRCVTCLTKKINGADMSDTEKILKSRGDRYGEFNRFALIAQELKYVYRSNCEYKEHDMPTYMDEAMDMILHKIARIINGDQYYIDSWQDIAGYAELVVKELKGDNK